MIDQKYLKWIIGEIRPVQKIGQRKISQKRKIYTRENEEKQEFKDCTGMINFIHVHTCWEICGTKLEQKIQTNLSDRESNHGF